MANSSSIQYSVNEEKQEEIKKESSPDQCDVKKPEIKKEIGPDQKDVKKAEKRKKKENKTRVPKKPLVTKLKMFDERKERFNKVQPTIDIIDNAIKAFDSPEIPKAKVSFEDLLATFEPIKEAMDKVVEAGKEQATEEDILVAAKMVFAAISDMLMVCKAVLRLASVKNFRFRLSEVGKDLAIELRKLLHLVRRHVPSQPYDAAYDVAINLAKCNLEKYVKSLVSIIENIQSAESRSNAVVKIDQQVEPLNSSFNLNESVESLDHLAASPDDSSPLALSVNDEEMAESPHEFIPFVDYPPSPVPSHNQDVEDEEPSFTLEYAPSPDSTQSGPVASYDSDPQESQQASYFENTAAIPLSPVAQTFSIAPVESSQEQPTDSNFKVEMSEYGSSNYVKSSNPSISDVSPDESVFLHSSIDLPLHNSPPLSLKSPSVEESKQKVCIPKSEDDQEVEFSTDDQQIEKSSEPAVKDQSPGSLEDGEIEDSIDYSPGPPTPKVPEPYPGIYGNRGNDTLEEMDETLNINAEFSPLGDENMSMEEENVPSSENAESNTQIDSKSMVADQESTAAIDKCSKKVAVPGEKLNADAWELDCILKINASMESTSSLPTLPLVVEPFAPIITNVISMALIPTTLAPSPSFGDVFIGTVKEEGNVNMEVMTDAVPMQPSVSTTPPPADVDACSTSSSSLESAYFSTSVGDPRESRCSNVSNPSPAQGEEVYVSFVSSSNHFWIQRKSCEEPIAQIEETLKSIDAEPAVNQLVIGDLYGVKHPDYDKWYRARLEKKEGENHQVTFVDYGDTHENIPSTSFRQLSVLNRYVPPFAVNCSFRWSVHVGEQEIDKVLAFTECTDNVVCHAVFGEKAGDLQIVDTLYAGDVNIFKFLFGDCKVDNAVEIQGIPRHLIPWKLTPIHVQ